MMLHSPKEELVRHLRPLYIQAHVSGQPINKVLVDNGAVVNILPSRMLKVLNEKDENLVHTDIKVSNFLEYHLLQEEFCLCKSKWTIKRPRQHFLWWIHHSTLMFSLMRDWIYTNACVPSSLHQTLIFLTNRGDEGKKRMEVH